MPDTVKNYQSALLVSLEGDAQYLLDAGAAAADDDEAVAEWTGHSGSDAADWSPVQAVAGAQGIRRAEAFGGIGGVEFNGVDETMSNGALGDGCTYPRTYTIVCRVLGTYTGTLQTMAEVGTNRYIFRISDISPYNWLLMTQDGDIDSGVAHNNTTGHVLTFVHYNETTDKADFWVNGVRTNLAAAVGEQVETGSWAFGAGLNGNRDTNIVFGAASLYNAKLTDDEIIEMHQFYNVKYSLGLTNLDASPGILGSEMGLGRNIVCD